MKRSLRFMLFVAMAVAFSISLPDSGYAVANQLQTDPGNKYKANQVLVMFKSDSKPLSKSTAQRKLRKGSGAVSDARAVKHWNFTKSEGTEAEGDLKITGYANVALIKSDTLSTKALIKKFKARDDVLYVEPNYILHATENTALTNDPYLKKQWSMTDSAANIGYQWKTKGITGSEEAVVAVVDTGVDYKHEDLKDQMWENDHYPDLQGEHGFDMCNADPDPMDDEGHGTHCAGVIAASANNGLGIAGVNQKVKIMALKMLDVSGSGEEAVEVSCYNYINKALDLGVPVRAINNSWGGGESSQIFAELIDIVGKKGAISVMAAGNNGDNNDEVDLYPANIDSEYIISVAATRPNGQLAPFSNYGKGSVDVAAPGVDILSTVSYKCFNPGLYDDPASISKHYTDYNDADVSSYDWGIPTLEQIRYSASADSHLDSSNYEAEIQPGEGFQGGNALKLTLKNLKKDSTVLIELPYALDSATESPKDAPHFSGMFRVSGGKYGASSLVAAEMPASASVKDEEELEVDYTISGYYVGGDDPLWDHYELAGLQDNTEDIPSQQRKFVLSLHVGADGDYTIYGDQVGVSKEDASVLCKYDYMSGTSMAAPFITGAVILKSQELAEEQQISLNELDPLDVSNAIITSHREESLPVISGGGFDFSKEYSKQVPRISSVLVGKDPGTIDIKGGGFYPDEPIKVEIGDYVPDAEPQYQEVNIVDGSRNERGSLVTVEAKDWINHIVSIRITDSQGNTTEKSNIYLVKGKRSYQIKKDYLPLPTGSLYSDGQYIYANNSTDRTIQMYDPANSENGFLIFSTLEKEDIFKGKEDPNIEYNMLLSRDITSIGNRLYTVAEYGQSVSSSGSDISIVFGDDTDSSAFAGEGALYTSEIRLLSLNRESGEIVSKIKLPDALRKTVDWTMTSYNGKLYFIGGYVLSPSSQKGFSSTVYIYDPSSKKWSVSPAQLPEGRAYGRALQTGKYLVYTLGYGSATAQDDDGDLINPDSSLRNLIFDGKSWHISTSADALIPYTSLGGVTRGDRTYAIYDHDIGICKQGILYAGYPAEGLGDCYFYDPTADRFQDTGYNYFSTTDEVTDKATVLNGQSYIFSEEQTGTAPISSGFIQLKAPNYSNGEITGASRSYAPGDRATIHVSADSGYIISQIKVGSKSIKLAANTRGKSYTTGPLLSNTSVTASFQQLPKKVAIKKLKAGKKKMTVKWSRPQKGVSYQLSYKLGKSKKWKTIRTSRNYRVIKKLKRHQIYAVRVRSCKKISGHTYYSNWSKTKKCKIK